MLSTASTRQNTTEASSDRIPFNYSYAYPHWFKENHQRIIEVLDHFGLIDSQQLLRLTGWPKQSAFRIFKQLERYNFIHAFAKLNWAQIEGARRAFVWGLLPRAAWRLSLQTSRPFSQFKTYQSVSMPATVEHSIDLTDIRLSFELHAQDAGIEIAEWKSESEWRVGEALQLPSVGRGRAGTVYPDGSAILRDRHGHKSYVFIEADRTNRNNWPEKIRAYKDLWSQGAFHRHFHVLDLTTGFRVLVTTKTKDRAKHLKRQVETVGQADLAGLFLFAPITEVATTENVYTSTIWGRGGHDQPQSLYRPTIAASRTIFDASVSPVLRIHVMPEACLPQPQVQLSFDAP